MVDVSNVKDIGINDRALIMESDYHSKCSVCNIAMSSGTNQNAIVAGLADRLPRVYTKKQSALAKIIYDF